MAVLVIIAGGVGGAFVSEELMTSRLQARYLTALGRELSFPMQSGASEFLPAPDGPYDSRLGYNQMPAFVDRLVERGHLVTRQARPSPRMVELADLGLFPAYHEKNRAGLRLLDCQGEVLQAGLYPERGYERFEDIPPLLVNSLLFIENRELLDPTQPRRNPAIEWGRFAKAAADQVISVVAEDRSTPGGSTLATQIEKYRHSPDGRTGSRREKLRQMGSASVRAYLDGEDTLKTRQRIVLDYLNTVPLSAKAGFGEVNGMGDGLWAWYGRDFDEVNRILGRPSAETGRVENGEDLPTRALAFKQALSLTIAQRRPSYYLAGGAQGLNELTDAHLRLLADEGVIQPSLRDAALAVQLKLREEPVAAPPVAFVTRKAVTSLRTHLSGLLGVPRLYDLDRLDLSASSTLHGEVQRNVTAVLRELGDPDRARAAGLYGFRMFSEGQDPSKVMFSFTLYESAGGANRLRLQTDNYDQPFDINEGARLDLGSTAKLRTLVSYLELVAALHTEYAGRDAAELRRLPRQGSDFLTHWALDYLATAGDRSLKPMLEAAMDRRYSASPQEQFFTGGGLHTFGNFNREDDKKVMTVREAFRNSVNLVFIRMMRDIVRYHVARNPAASGIFTDPDDPRRRDYLNRFADREGKVFLSTFYRKHQGHSPDESVSLMVEGLQPTPRRLAVILRATWPEASLAEFGSALGKHLRESDKLSEGEILDLYDRFGPGRYSLPDQGYLAGIHPLELWLAGFLRTHPGATLSQVLEASGDERLAVYTWLFRTRHKNAQDVRIRSLLEVEAFIEIGHSWRRLGYPFESLTPSYASSIGSSADRPAALAELVGIIVNKGKRLPVVRLDSLHFAAGTPYETELVRGPGAPEQVLPEALTEVVRGAMVDVAENGTARRLKGVFHRADGSPLVVGGKTGTGDHRYDVYGKGGQLVSSRVVTRSATLVFLVGDRFFGTLTAYVGEPYAEQYAFTSSLAVQLARSLAPLLEPLMAEDAQGQPASCRIASDA
ncbi:transglycosylase domain-containing protein [Azoarcus indigens]|uniref:peptidoglycan glycosyltransferase n=1 Tax=Azoarcus indigens TaxID=29545 RepID=A0A4R6DL87_9RHOO|nr:transglycosylase domain-containing protein [Azoarcus indigens]TDN45493.1 membrane peptidoglycan carboxypeptidase [Azoarcus indigens]